MSNPVDRVERPMRIDLKVQGHVEEARATGVMYPGQLITVSAPDEGNAAHFPPNCAVHAAQGVVTGMYIVKNQTLVGKTILDAYADNDIVPYVAALPGDIVFLRVDPQSSFAVGDKLTSAGDGNFEAQGGGDIALAEVMETVDFSDDETDELIHVRARVL